MIHDFTYCVPTQVVFGRDTEKQVGEMLRSLGGSRILVIYGGGSVVRSGLLARVADAMNACGLCFFTKGGVKPNPRLSFVKEAIDEYRSESIDFLLAVGGGSVIDSAKFIAHGLANPAVDVTDIWLKKTAITKSLPVGVVLTIPAAGSETSDSAVLSDDIGVNGKRGLGTPLNRPSFAIMNPALAGTLPAYQVACGVSDIMMHTLDRYFNPLANELTDALAEALLRTVIFYGPQAVESPDNYDAMSEIMWAGSLSHNGLTGLGGIKDFAPHQLGHELSAAHDVAHGASLAAIWDSWAVYVCPDNVGRFARYARKVWGICESDDEMAAAAGIQATRDFFKSIGMPTSVTECVGKQTDRQLSRLAHGCSYGRTRTIGSLRELDFDDMLTIYSMANK